MWHRISPLISTSLWFFLVRYSFSENWFRQGYDVVVMANPNRHVVGLDLSKTSVERSTKVCGLDFISWMLEKKQKSWCLNLKCRCSLHCLIQNISPSCKKTSSLGSHLKNSTSFSTTSILLSSYNFICFDVLVHMRRITI